jgi:hypothetical protein
MDFKRSPFGFKTRSFQERKNTRPCAIAKAAAAKEVTKDRNKILLAALPHHGG